MPLGMEPLGTEVGLGPGDVVLDGNPAPPRMGTAPQFSAHVCCGETTGWMKMPLGTSWYGSRPRPRPHCVRRGPSSPAKGAQQPAPLFGACLLWPRSPISATAELLLYCIAYCTALPCVAVHISGFCTLLCYGTQHCIVVCHVVLLYLLLVIGL